MSRTVKIVVPPPAKKGNLSRGGCQNVPPRDKCRKKLNVFYTCNLWVRTAAILSSINCRDYGFLRKLIKNNLFSAPILQNRTVHFTSTLRQQFFINVNESTKNMLKQRIPDFFQIIFEIESMN